MEPTIIYTDMGVVCVLIIYALLLPGVFVFLIMAGLFFLDILKGIHERAWDSNMAWAIVCCAGFSAMTWASAKAFILIQFMEAVK